MNYSTLHYKIPIQFTPRNIHGRGTRGAEIRFNM